MKQKITIMCLGLALLLSSTITNAEDLAFQEKKMYFSAGYGFGNLTKALFKTYEGNFGFKYSSFGPAFVKGEYAVTENVGIGLQLAYFGASLSYTDTYDDFDPSTTDQSYIYKLSYSSLSVLGRINYHFATTEKFDSYFGLASGMRTGKWDYSVTPSRPNETLTFGKGGGIGFEMTLGARYFFTPQIGAYTEIGIAKGFLQLGVTFTP